MDLLRGDVASFRRDLEELRAEQQQTVVTLGQLKQDVDASVRNSQGAVGLLTETKAEVSPFIKTQRKWVHPGLEFTSVTPS